MINDIRMLIGSSIVFRIQTLQPSLSTTAVFQGPPWQVTKVVARNADPGVVEKRFPRVRSMQV